MRQTIGAIDTLPVEYVYTCYRGNNATVIAAAAKLYIKPGQTICDPTYGKGAFWKKIDLSQVKLCASDILTLPGRAYDLRNLPYTMRSFDHFVLDPPYAHNPGAMKFNFAYQNVVLKGNSHRQIIELYEAGIREAKRLLKSGGLLWVKCKDEIESGKQKWSHIEIFNVAVHLGFSPEELFVSMQPNRPIIQHKLCQHHARKNHSFLWIMKK